MSELVVRVCSVATFHYVSVSKPNPVWFGKRSINYWLTFPNQIQFGFENNCVKFGGKWIPNQIQFGFGKKTANFRGQKSQINYSFVWKYFSTTLSLIFYISHILNVAISERCPISPTEAKKWKRNWLKIHKSTCLQSFRFKGKGKLCFTFQFIFF